MASNVSEWFEYVSRLSAFLTVAGSALAAAIQYRMNSRAEQRLRNLAELEADVKVSQLFNDLVQTANGYGVPSDPQETVQSAIFDAVPKDVLQSIIMNDPRDVAKLLSGSIISGNVPLAKQLAAAESIATLAIKYPILLDAALVGLDVTAGISDFAGNAYGRLCNHYGLHRPLTQWDQKWTIRRAAAARPKAAEGSEAQSTTTSRPAAEDHCPDGDRSNQQR